MTPERRKQVMQTIIDGLVDGLSYTGAARSAGVTSRSLFGWIKLSQSDDPDYSVEMLGEVVPFATAVTTARRIMLHTARSEFERRSHLGHDEIVYFQGQVTWKLDPRAMAIDDPDTRELCGYRRDGLLEIDGALVANTAHREPPVAATLAMLSMGFPSEYIPKTKQEIQQTVISGGVIQPKAMTRPPVIPPAPERPQLEVLPDVDPDIAELLGEPEELPDEPDDLPEPSPLGVAVIDAAAIAAQPRPSRFIPPGFRSEFDKLVAKGVIRPDGSTATEPPVIRQPTSATPYASQSDPLIRPTENGRRPLSDAERALLGKLPNANTRKA